MIKQSFTLFKHAFNEDKSNRNNLLTTIALELISIAVLYWLNTIYGALYQSIQDYNVHGIWLAIIEFCVGAFAIVVVQGYTGFVTNQLAFSIRNGLTNFYLTRLNTLREIENIEQRMQEDLRNFGSWSVDFWLAIFKAAIKLPLFLGVIISLTQWYIGIIILAVVIIGTLLTRYLSLKLVGLQSAQETNEANFRKAIPDITMVDRAIQMYGFIVAQFKIINQKLKVLSFVQAGFSQSFVLLPFIVLMPLYLSKSITMGNFFQSVSALSKVIDSLTILIDNRQLQVNISTCLKRMESLK